MHLRLTSVFLALLTCAGSLSAGPSRQADGPTGPDWRTRPDPEGTPTRVALGVYLVDMYEIDDVKQTFGADFILFMTWSDPRLIAGASGVVDGHRLVNASEIWTPQPMLVNARDVAEGASDEVRVEADGRCSFSKRYTGALSFRSDLSEFPMDEQDLIIQVLIPPRVGEVVLEEDRTRSGLWEELSIPNWRLRGTETTIYDRYLPQIAQDAHIFEFGLQVERHLVYYVWKLIVPLIMVVMMSWSVFWISPKAVVQLGLGATSVLTLIAYRFATATLLPPIGYLTRLDLFLTASSVLVLAALIEALASVGLADVGKLQAALRLDRACRVAFPVIFVGVILWSFWL